MSATYQARPTLYKGVRMRSRLEALYAAWLDNHQLDKWTYEPMAFGSPDGQYLPDFFVCDAGPNPDLPVQRTAWQEAEAGYVMVGQFIEVKPPGADFAGALARMHVIRATYQESDLVVVTNFGTYEQPQFRPAAVCLHHKGCSHPGCVEGLADEWRELTPITGTL